MVTAPGYIMGGTSFSYESGGEEHYTPLAGTPAFTALTPMHSPGYPAGDIFPWASNSYLVYAGDCVKNNPATTANPEGLKPAEALVTPGATTKVKVAMSQVILNVYTGKVGSTTLTGEALPLQITNTNCKESTANNATKPLYVHEQKLASGHLETPYQPFGSFSLCVYSATKKKNYTVNYTNETQPGSTRNIYLEENTVGEQTVVSNPTTPC
jgi:hypothetical protein